MKKIKLTGGKFAIIDDEDYERINQHKWFISTNKSSATNYAVRNRKSTEKNKIKLAQIKMHREILNYFDYLTVDHINGNGLDNRRINLRLCTVFQNTHNLRTRKTNTSGYKGVVWYKAGKYWQAQIKVNYKNIYLGRFLNKKEAALAYNNGAIKYFGEFANLNFK
jgi:hypothetical protein